MRFARFPAPTTALFLLAACAADGAGEGSSVAPPGGATQACADLGLTPGTPAFARCETGERARQKSAERGVTGTLFRDVTMAPMH